MSRILSALILGAIGGLILFPVIVGSGDPSKPISTAQIGYETPAASASGAPSVSIAESRRNAIVSAVERVSPAVVGVHTTYLKEYQVRYRDPFWNFLHPGIVREKTPGIGSGFVIREDGYVLTNHHVVKGAQAVSIVLPDGRRFSVTDIRNNVWIDWQNDLAVIHVDAQDLPVAALGDTGDVIIGEWAIAIGNPFGLELEDPKPTVTVGVVSAVGRNFQPEDDGPIYQDMIQTDASINPGNSGGPLVNSAGDVIGVNTFIFSKSGGSLGIGFAIPINRAMEAARRLIEGGDFWTGFWLSHQNLSPWLAAALGLAADQGALITRVEEGSPAARARLNPGDLIYGINGSRVRRNDDVEKAFQRGRIGEVFVLEILRGRRKFRTELVLEQAPRSR